MERKHIAAALIAIGVVSAIGFGLWLSDQGESQGETSADEARVGSSRTSSRSRSIDDGPKPQDEEARAWAQVETPLSGPGAIEEQEDPRWLMPPPVDVHADRTTGWRLGRTRAELVIVERRMERIREALASLENGGDEAVIQQQRAILARFEARRGTLEEQARTLETQATDDETIAEADRGFADNAREERPALHSGVPPGEVPPG